MKYEMVDDSMPTWNSPPKARILLFFLNKLKHENR